MGTQNFLPNATLPVGYDETNSPVTNATRKGELLDSIIKNENAVCGLVDGAHLTDCLFAQISGFLFISNRDA